MDQNIIQQKFDDVVGTVEAAEMLGYHRSSVRNLCLWGKLEGAKKVGRDWLSPRVSVEKYEKGPQGFAVKPYGSGRVCGYSEEERREKNLLTTIEAAEVLGYRSKSVGNLCALGKLEGAEKIGGSWVIPRASVESYKGEKGSSGEKTAKRRA